MNSYACAGCAALNSKWHRAKQEGAECRQRLDETMEESLVTAARVKELEEEMEGMREKLAERARAVEQVKQSEAATRKGLEAEIRRLAQEGMSRSHVSEELHAREQSERDLRQRLEDAEMEAGRLLQEQQALRDAAAQAEARADAAAVDAAAAVAAAQAERGAARAEVEDAVREQKRLFEEEAAARRAAEKQAADASSENERIAALEAELAKSRADHQETKKEAEVMEAKQQKMIDDLQKRLDELSRRNRELEGLRDSQKLQSSKLASAVARAQEAEGERSRAEAAMRQKLAAAEEAAEEAKAEAAAAKEEAKAAKAECEEAKADVQQQREAQKPPDMRELLSAVKIAVLAPCLRLHINGADPIQAGSAEQVDFGSLSGMLEEAVLKRYSQVTLLDGDTPLAQGGAHVIFPELKETMAHVQREVKDRLVMMMQSAGDNNSSGAAASNGTTPPLQAPNGMPQPTGFEPPAEEAPSAPRIRNTTTAGGPRTSRKPMLAAIENGADSPRRRARAASGAV